MHDTTFRDGWNLSYVLSFKFLSASLTSTKLFSLQLCTHTIISLRLLEKLLLIFTLHMKKKRLQKHDLIKKFYRVKRNATLRCVLKFAENDLRLIDDVTSATALMMKK